MKKTHSIPYLLFLCALLSCQQQNSLGQNDFISDVKELFQGWEGEIPGGAIAIIKEGEVLYEDYFGLSNLKKKEPFSVNTRTDIGSISKQFTACLIALLEEEQKLSIEDDIRIYLPEIPFYGDTLKIKHLLFHTSGIKDYEALVMMKGEHYFDEHMSNPYVLGLLEKQKSLNFRPGSASEYSNSNYILLTSIIERVTKEDLMTCARKKIFEPLDMKHTFFHINQGDDFKHRAIGYTSTDSGFSRPVYRSHLIGDGGIFTTLSDMIKWDQNFQKNQLGQKKESLLQRMKYRESLPNGRLNSMAFAQIFSPHPFEENSWSHGGSGGGYRSFYIRFEEARFSVIVLTNSDENNAFEKANAITNLYFKYLPSQKNDRNPPDSKEKTEFQKIEQKHLDAFTGYYYDEKEIDVMQMYLDSTKQQLVSKWLKNKDEGYPCLPIGAYRIAELEDSKNQYYLKGDSLMYEFEGKIERRWIKCQTPVLPIKEIEATYYSEEIDHQVSFKRVGDRLISKNNFLTSLQRIGNVTFLDRETFSVLKFAPDEQGIISRFSINIPRGDRTLKNLYFQRIEE